MLADCPIKLLLVDQDPIFRLGLQVALEEFDNIHIVGTAETYTTALQILAEAQQEPANINLVILDLGSAHSTSSQQLGLQLCQQLKNQYPNLSVLLLSSVQQQGLLLAAKAAGINGYCPKGTPVSELVIAIQEIIAGRSYWFGEVQKESRTGSLLKWKRHRVTEDTGNPSKQISSSPFEFRDRSKSEAPVSFPQSDPSHLPLTASPSSSSTFPLAKLQNHLRLSGMTHINASLAKVKAKLQFPGLSLLERSILVGRQRELLTARWLLNRLLASPNQKRHESETENSTFVYLPPVPNSSISNDIPDSERQIQNTPSLVSPKSLQAALFASCINKLQFNLKNLTDIPLEIDILRLSKKRELLYTVLKKVTITLEDIENSTITIEHLENLKKNILFDIWHSATTEFFGKYSTVKLGHNQLEIVNFLLQDTEVVQTEILNKIPLTKELLSYLLFQTDLRVDNTLYVAGSIEAKKQGLMLLENLLIQVANGVVQPLLNRLADVEEIKENFYDRHMISTREIERFRNNLSWRYRIKRYINEPQEIFESRYEIFVFSPRGIATVSIYAPRREELAQLSGIPLIVTLMLEFRDAIAPPLQSLLSFLGSGVIFILTQIIGRGLGLIARGILQGIASVSLVEKKNR